MSVYKPLIEPFAGTYSSDRPLIPLIKVPQGLTFSDVIEEIEAEVKAQKGGEDHPRVESHKPGTASITVLSAIVLGMMGFAGGQIGWVRAVLAAGFIALCLTAAWCILYYSARAVIRAVRRRADYRNSTGLVSSDKKEFTLQEGTKAFLVGSWWWGIVEVFEKDALIVKFRFITHRDRGLLEISFMEVDFDRKDSIPEIMHSVVGIIESNTTVTRKAVTLYQSPGCDSAPYIRLLNRMVQEGLFSAVMRLITQLSPLPQELVAALKKGGPDAQTKAVERLKEYPNALGLLKEQFNKQKEDAVRTAIIYAVVHMQADSSLDWLKDIVYGSIDSSDDDFMVPVAAISQMGRLSGQKVYPVLKGIFNKLKAIPSSSRSLKQSNILKASIKAMGKVAGGSKDIEKLLIELTAEEDTAVVHPAVEALAGFPSQETVNALRAVKQGKMQKYSWITASAEESLRAVIQVLEPPEMSDTSNGTGLPFNKLDFEGELPRGVGAAYYNDAAFAEPAESEGEIPAYLVSALTSKEFYIRAWAAQRLRNHPEASQLLRERLENEDRAEVRCQVIYSIVRIERGNSLPLLKKIVGECIEQGKDCIAASSAIRAIGNLRTDAAYGVLRWVYKVLTAQNSARHREALLRETILAIGKTRARGSVKFVAALLNSTLDKLQENADIHPLDELKAQAAAQALKYSRNQKSLSTLRRALSSGVFWITYFALDSLEKMDAYETVNDIKGLIESQRREGKDLSIVEKARNTLDNIRTLFSSYLRVKQDPALVNPADAIAYFRDKITPGLRWVLKRAVYRKNRLDEEALGELVGAMAVENNIKNSSVESLNTNRTPQGEVFTEIDFILEVDKKRHAIKDSQSEDVDDGVYLCESKTLSREEALSLPAMIEVTIKEKLERYVLAAEILRASGRNIKGIVFVMGGEVIAPGGVKEFSWEQRKDLDKQLQDKGLKAYVAVIPEVVEIPGEDGLGSKERSRIESWVSNLADKGMLDRDKKEGVRRLFTTILLYKGGWFYLQRLINKAMTEVGVSPYSQKGQMDKAKWEEIIKKIYLTFSEVDYDEGKNRLIAAYANGTQLTLTKVDEGKFREVLRISPDERDLSPERIEQIRQDIFEQLL
ncbi:MAG: hypothetical protein JRI96_17000, partial [Deltaproteobacteria bacterium]|nr:hypothetical protein [Deltaproteobacteria bacterium]